ncbi:MAG: hypothetical protein U0871_05880 [Gemmataceae bacterium]
MTAIVKKCLLAALVAAGLVASSGSASAGFQIVFDWGAGNPPVQVPAYAGPVTPYVIQTIPGSGLKNTGNVILDLWDGTLNSGTDLTLQYTITVDPSTASMTLTQFRLEYSNNTAQALAPINFTITISEDQGSIPAALGDSLLLNAGFTVTGAAPSTLRPQADVFQTGQVPNPATVAITGGPIPPFVPLSNIPLNLAGSTPFQRGTSGNVTTMVTLEYNLSGYTNASLANGFVNITQNVVPAPAGLVLAGLGLPALGLAKRFRRKVAA